MNPNHTLPLRRSWLSAILAVGALFAGCGPVKFYPGEERPDSEISRLLFNSSGAELSVVTFDGITHPHPGRTLEVLPGAHTLVVKYSKTFSETGAPLTRYGTCSITFRIEAAQELYVFVEAVADTGLSPSAPPMITLRPTGYDQPALFQERCREESKAQNGTFMRGKSATVTTRRNT
ncbi:MAG: hypothetical protein RL518_1252 [Pseudomonadota bacterium]|jgi:hypothetical protein